MKKFAIYLPQFHEIPENDEWWGKGFTEWTNVKKAVPLYEGHIQPKVPYNNNYYCLDNPSVLQWQDEIASSYGIDGMIFYHYYFTGKLLLEKPAEILLKNKNIPMKFFFCWANHSWFRSWEGSKKLLMEQKYGTEADWERHFDYLLPFFQDDRYEKKDNKPIFMIFKPFFKEKQAMMEFFNKKCIETGFDGLCVIETCTDYSNSTRSRLLNENSSYSKYIFIREPDAALSECKKTIRFKIFRIYEKIRRVLKLKGSSPIQRISADWLYDIMKVKQFDKQVIRGAFFEWDNTPRHSDRGYVILPVSENNFYKYLDSVSESEYLLINAWNEWCEGMMLEPTEENGFKYLNWIKKWSEKA